MTQPTVNYQLVPVRGKYVSLAGTPMRGTVSFTGAPDMLTDPAADTIIVPATITATLDSTGSFVAMLPATDDPDITPANWTYQVRESLKETAQSTATSGRTFHIDVPLASAGAGIDLSDVAPVPPAPVSAPAYVLLAAHTALEGRVDALEAAGGGTAIPAGTTPPASPAVGDLWLDTT